MSDTPPLTSTDLPNLGIVADLDEETRAVLSSYGQFSYHASGQTVIRQGEDQNRLFFVLSGELHACRSEGERTILLGEIRSGESFGEINMFDPGTASASVLTVGPVQLWSIDRSNLSDFFGMYPQASVCLVVRIAEILGRRLRAVTRKLESRVDYELLLAELKQ
jgi:CRP-like cAMP-binding protein